MASIRKIRAAHRLQQDISAALIEAINVYRRSPQAMVDMIASAVRAEVLAPVVAEALASQAIADTLEV